MPELIIPAHLKRARVPIKVTFLLNRSLNRLMIGLPEQFPTPPGWEKIVCTTAAEVDAMSARLRRQEQIDEEMTDEQRDAIEGPIRDYARKELVTLMMNSSNSLNRDFCRFALARMDEADAARRKNKRTSYQHAEGYEAGH